MLEPESWIEVAALLFIVGLCLNFEVAVGPNLRPSFDPVIFNVTYHLHSSSLLLLGSPICGLLWAKAEWLASNLGDASLGRVGSSKPLNLLRLRKGKDLGTMKPLIQSHLGPRGSPQVTQHKSTTEMNVCRPLDNKAGNSWFPVETSMVASEPNLNGLTANAERPI
ncbi:hypothetical protein C8R44DRAFT_741368 [Mycena epipterygia]|nr:hypothetical protein C8R44DRAFT_741368 [Mycena epipterygia]